MTTHIALLRGINVGGHKSVAMAALRGFMEGLGFDDVRSLLQTGNLVFRSNGRTTAGLERMLETEAATRLDLHTTSSRARPRSCRRSSPATPSITKQRPTPATSSSCS